MMLAGAADVFGTNLDVVGLKSRPIPATFEFMGAMMVVTVFLAVSYAQHERRHIRVELLVRRLPAFGRKLTDVIQYGPGNNPVWLNCPLWLGCGHSRLQCGGVLYRADQFSNCGLLDLLLQSVLH